MKNQLKQVPTVFWAIAVIATIWNLMGVTMYLSDIFISPESLATMEPAKRNLHENIPIYIELFYGLGVFSGLLGSVGLLLRKSWAVPFFLISLIAVVLQFSSSILFTDALNILGSTALILPAVVILIAAFLFGYSRYLRSRGVLT